MSDEGLPFESLTEELLSFMELKLKSAPLPLTIIHQPRFALTLLLCKCLCHISRTGWPRGAALNWAGGEAGAEGGRPRLSCKQVLSFWQTGVNAEITTLLLFAVLVKLIPLCREIKPKCKNRWWTATHFFHVANTKAQGVERGCCSYSMWPLMQLTAVGDELRHCFLQSHINTFHLVPIYTKVRRDRK